MAKSRLKKTSHLRQICARFAEHAPFRELINGLDEQANKPVTITGLSGSSEAMLISQLAAETDRPVLVVTQRSGEASDLYEDLLFLMGEDKVGLFPGRQILPYDFRAPVGEVMGQRISSLTGLLNESLSVVICPIRALLEPTMPIRDLKDNMLDLKVGQEIDIDELADRLVQLGFRRVPLVEEVGDFARRGGLVDFFTPGDEAPVRIELYGDEIDTIRTFEVTNQRSIAVLDQVQILPRREIPITPHTVEKYLDRLPEEDADYVRMRYFKDPELPGLEWLAVLFGLEKGCLLDYLPKEGIVFLQGEGTLMSESESIMDEARGLYARLQNRFARLPQPEEYYAPSAEIFSRLGAFSMVDHLPFRGGRADIVTFNCRPHPSFGARMDLLGNALRQFRTEGTSYVIATDGAGQAHRLGELISEKAGLDAGAVIEVANLKGGFICPSGGLAVLTDHQIFSRYHRRVRRKKFKEGVAISDYASLNQGDHVVHTEFGIARYLGLETIHVDGRNRDCLLLQYEDNDRLFVPIEEFNRVSKYSGKDTEPTLTRLGGPGWEKLKKKTRKAIEDMAEELIKLYAERKASGGMSFGEDSVWLKQLEASFPFEETPDQEKAINDVKRDMTSEQPMDRLVCGDVGFGKTEVAVRAAFKAIDGGKQVAVLVPTTILAQQHLATFSERLENFPMRVEMLSRFRTRKEQLVVVDDLAEGKVDLVIGTHRLLSKDVMFKDLGLLIIDEEHRFGVRHKEKLRKMKAGVDTIAMTATPIPRTLQMSMMGVRDMSIITTSPKGRLPILTEVVEFDPAIIATAILREIDRGGQVFFVHNRVQTIDAMYRYLKKILPQVEIGIGHGQMHEKSLEGVMLGFMSKRYDVLLCTAIIESGLDIPSANTIIMNRADRFGLAQLYQLRGRVGRSSRRAYCYLVSPPPRIMRPDSIKRLRALEAHSDLGSGFALAMRDLEIRGAGEVLGARQSGFIEEIGYDMYNRLLEEAVAKLKGQELQRLPDTKLETPYEIHLPETYVNDNQHKVDIYRRLADCRNLDQVEKIRDEVTDRFGKPPKSAENAFDASAVKISAALLELEKVSFKQDKVHLFFEEDRKLQRREVEAFRKATDRPMEFSLIGHPRVTIDLKDVPKEQRLLELRGILSKVG